MDILVRSSLPKVLNLAIKLIYLKCHNSLEKISLISAAEALNIELTGLCFSGSPSLPLQVSILCPSQVDTCQQFPLLQHHLKII